MIKTRDKATRAADVDILLSIPMFLRKEFAI